MSRRWNWALNCCRRRFPVGDCPVGQSTVKRGRRSSRKSWPAESHSVPIGAHRLTDNVMIAQSNYDRIYQLSQADAYWVARES